MVLLFGDQIFYRTDNTHWNSYTFSNTYDVVSKGILVNDTIFLFSSGRGIFYEFNLKKHELKEIARFMDAYYGAGVKLYHEGKLYVMAAGGDGLFVTEDMGETWKHFDIGFWDIKPFNDHFIINGHKIMTKDFEMVKEFRKPSSIDVSIENNKAYYHQNDTIYILNEDLEVNVYTTSKGFSKVVKAKNDTIYTFDNSDVQIYYDKKLLQSNNHSYYSNINKVLEYKDDFFFFDRDQDSLNIFDKKRLIWEAYKDYQELVHSSIGRITDITKYKDDYYVISESALYKTKNLENYTFIAKNLNYMKNVEVYNDSIIYISDLINHKSTDYGNTFQKTNYNTYFTDASDNIIYMFDADYRTKINRLNKNTDEFMSPIYLGGSAQNIKAYSGDTIIISELPNIVHISTDGLANMRTVTFEIPGRIINNIEQKGRSIYAMEANGNYSNSVEKSLHISRDFGNTWTSVPMSFYLSEIIAINDTLIYAIGEDKLIRSEDGGLPGGLCPSPIGMESIMINSRKDPM